MQEHKAYRIVIRNFHPTTNTAEIRTALEEIGYQVRQITNVLYKHTKINLPIFFVDLEPSELNKDIFHVNHILHTKIKIEEPYKRRDIVQCLNCQEYGHTKTYCSHTPRCVRCAEHHPTSTCQKPRNLPAKCALCQGEHHANYKGCQIHKELQKLRNPNSRSNQPTSTNNQFNPKTTAKAPSAESNPSSFHNRTYANVTSNQEPPKSDSDQPDPDNPSSYRPITLLPFFSKLFEKLILTRIYPIIKEKKLIPDTQFGFREHHSTIHQIHRLADTIACSLEKKLYTSAVFLDISQAFDKGWHPGLLFKLKTFLPPSYYLFFKSYLSERHFLVRSGTEHSSISPILAGVPQGAVASPTLFNLYSADQPINPNTQIAEYADDKVIFSSHTDPGIVSTSLQNHLNDLSYWYSHWRVKINEKRLLEHENSVLHTQNVCSLKSLEISLNKEQGSIDKELQNLIKTEENHWRLILKTIVDIIMNLASEGSAFRGSGELIENIGKSNQSGKFLNLINLISHYNEPLKEHLERHKKGGLTYFSHGIQNEFLEIISNKIKREIISKIKSIKYYSIIFDCTPDTSHEEQMSKMIRYVVANENGCEIVESFLGFIRVYKKTSEALSEDIINSILQNDLSLDDCQGQSYDNGANIAGKSKGV
ncbi:hypothetical protein QTP88_001764 [Uroleucon formosanum]